MTITSLINTLDKYMIRGILDSGISQDGGIHCYQEIPFLHHTAFVLALSMLLVPCFLYWKHHLTYSVKEQQPYLLEKILAFLSFISWILTFYFKLKTGKGIFMLNPCHLVLLIQIYLLLNKNTTKNITIYSAWSGWLFGAYMAMLVPHLNGISPFQIFLYYFEHIVIIPFGYWVLNKRYGFLKPTLKNQMASFSTIVFWQIWVLVPVGRTFMINLNYALCHSPADPTYSVFGPYYFLVCTFGLNVLSYMARWISYIQVKVLYNVLGAFGIKGPEMMPITNGSCETPSSEKM